jgi:hypothetical protein
LEIFDSAVMMSSAMPSAKYSCSGSPERLLKGSTAIEGTRRCAPCSASLPCAWAREMR